MTDAPILPGARAAFVNPDGTPSRPFYDYLRRQSLSTNATAPSVTQLTDDVVTLAQKLGADDGKPASITTPIFHFVGYGGITASQDGRAVKLSLSDLADSAAGSLLAITRDAKGRITGTRDATITGTAGRVTVANGSAAAGVPTLDLDTVADAGGGALLRFARDAWGRITGTSAATTTDLAEGTNLYFTNARAAAAAPVQAVAGRTGTVTLAKADVGLGNVDNTSDANKPVSTAQAAADALKLDKSIPAGYIDGLKMVWNSGTSISVTSGAAYIQGSSAIISSPSTLTLSSLSLTASTWYHLYLYINAGTPAIECVATAPAAAYSGVARSKTGDTSRRYIGSVRTDASGNIYNFSHNLTRGGVLYQQSIVSAPFLVLAGTATTATNVSCSGVVPITSSIAYMTTVNNDTTAVAIIGNAVIPPSGTGPLWLDQMKPTGTETLEFLLDGSQSFQYMFTSSATGAFVVRVKGYFYER